MPRKTSELRLRFQPLEKEGLAAVQQQRRAAKAKRRSQRNQANPKPRRHNKQS